jgi:hypothetical protein
MGSEPAAELPSFTKVEMSALVNIGLNNTINNVEDETRLKLIRWK